MVSCRGVETVEQAVAQRFGDHQIALGVEPGEEPAAREQLPLAHVAPRLQHREHAIELPGQGLGLAGDAALEPGDVSCDPVGLPRAAERDLGAGDAVQRVGAHPGFDVADACVGVVGGRVVTIGQAPEQRDRRPLEGGAPGCERARELDGRDAADRPRKVVGGQAHGRALLGQGEHAVARPPALLLQDHRPAAAPRGHDDVAGSQLVEAAVLDGVRRPPGVIPIGEQRAVLLDVAVGHPGGVTRPRELLAGLFRAAG